MIRSTLDRWPAQNVNASPTKKRTMKKSKDHLKEACQAHTNLNIFAAVVSLLEGGHLYGCDNDAAAQRIIGICKREQDKCLRRYDHALADARNVP